MRRGAGIALVAALVLGSCITPSIPIPPPDPGKMSFAVKPGDGTATFQYPPDINYVGSTVFIYNRDKGKGVIEDAHPDGSVGPTQPLPAVLGDQIIVSFQRADQTVSTCIRLREGKQDPNDFCGP
jgi:hypothetical protein